MALIPKVKQMYTKTRYKIHDYLAPIKRRLPTLVSEDIYKKYLNNIKYRNEDDTHDPITEDDPYYHPSHKENLINSSLQTRKTDMLLIQHAKAYKKGVVEDPKFIDVKNIEEWKRLRNDPKAYYKELELKQKVTTAAVVATQAPAAQAVKPYEDASSSSFKTKKDVYDSIPSTRSSGVGSRATNPETFKNGVVNMARTMDASANQISKLLKMDAKLLEELYYDKPFLFDLYFEYSLYDDFGASHEDSGINKLIESYEYKYGVTL